MKEKMKGCYQDNKMVKDSHQEGIKRVLQRKEDRNDVAGHNGKMGMHHASENHFKRSGRSLTPRKA